MDFFSSDWHLNHKNIMEAAKRPFESVDAMNEQIINSVYSFAKAGDFIYFIGDLTFNSELAEKILASLKKRKINFVWILGNHDKKLNLNKLEPYCHEICEQKTIKRNHIKINMSHFPQLTWDGSFYNSFHLYGHIHNNSPELMEVEKRMIGKTLNVNVEFNDYRMYNLHDIFRIMDGKPDNWDYLILKKHYEDKGVSF